jgi:hypothetical protein
MSSAPHTAVTTPAAASQMGSEVPFGANEMRLNARQWIVSLGLTLLVLLVTPRLWPKVERFETAPDYRIPYELSNDYWLFGQRLRQVTDSRKIVLLGDSVVWGEYVLPDGTLSHFLNRDMRETDRFINAGLNGVFPIALEGLVRHYGKALRHQQVVLHCNVLWMTSPKADLSTEAEESFNHAALVPQFVPRIPCYRAGAHERLSTILSQSTEAMAWVVHLQSCYFRQQSIPKWTLEDDGSDPPRFPNVARNPLAQITLQVPSQPEHDPQRGPQSPRHKAWAEGGRGTTPFDWVRLESSLQWRAFQQVIAILKQRDNKVLVVLGPFNEHMMSEDSRPAYRALRDGIAAWLEQHEVPHVAPEPLPSALYADASHPLTEGYALLAARLVADGLFQRWLED